jgi:hypothetical protein
MTSKVTNIMTSNSSDYCIYGITLLLQKDDFNEALNILYTIVNIDGTKRSCAGKKNRKKQY